MTRYQRETHCYDSGGFDTTGRIVTVLSHSPASHRLTVLVEKEQMARGLRPFQVPPEGMSLEEVAKEIEVGPAAEETCSGIDGACSRTVETPGDTCWQHEDE